MSVKKDYNAWADQYDTNQNRTRDLDKKATIHTLRKYRFETVLELGCGTGKNTEWLVKHAKKIIGMDFSKGMLHLAKAKITDPKVVFKKADIRDNWDVPNNSLDLLTSSLTLEHISDLNHIFRQANLKLKKNGLFFICELHPFKQYTGTKARFETQNTRRELEVYTHHISDYIHCAHQNQFRLLELKEWFDDDTEGGLPRLVSFVFKKNKK